MSKLNAFMALAVLLLAACSDQSSQIANTESDIVEIPVDEAVILITNAHIIDGAGNVFENGSVLIEDGLISAVGNNLMSPLNAFVVDAGGKTVMPGFIEGHRHIIQGNPDEWMANRAEENMQEFLLPAPLGLSKPSRSSPKPPNAFSRPFFETLGGPRFPNPDLRIQFRVVFFV